MRRVVFFIAVLLSASVMLTPMARAASIVENSELGYRMAIPDGWTTMNSAQIKALNNYMAQFLGGGVRGTDLEVKAGYRPVGQQLVYPFIVVGTEGGGKVPADKIEAFNKHALERVGTLLNSKVYHPAGSADDIAGSKFDRDNWTFTISAEPGGMLFRIHYVFTSNGVYVFRAFFDQRSMLLIPAVDRAFRSITLHDWLLYEPERTDDSEPGASSARNVWIIYAMALLVLVGVWLTDFPSDEEDHPH